MYDYSRSLEAPTSVRGWGGRFLVTDWLEAVLMWLNYWYTSQSKLLFHLTLVCWVPGDILKGSEVITSISGNISKQWKVKAKLTRTSFLYYITFKPIYQIRIRETNFLYYMLLPFPFLLQNKIVASPLPYLAWHLGFQKLGIWQIAGLERASALASVTSCWKYFNEKLLLVLHLLLSQMALIYYSFT